MNAPAPPPPGGSLRPANFDTIGMHEDRVTPLIVRCNLCAAVWVDRPEALDLATWQAEHRCEDTRAARIEVDPWVAAGRDLAGAARRVLPWVAGAVLGAAFVGILVLAGLSSFENVRRAAEAAAYSTETSWRLPAMVDGGIFVFTGVGLFVSWVFRGRLAEGDKGIAGLLLLIRAIVWLLVGYTLVLNTADAKTWWDVAAHSVGGMLVALGAEVVEQLIRRLAAGAAHAARLARRVPRRRWVARPFNSARLWLLMHAWDMTWAEVLASERLRLRETILDALRLRHPDEPDERLLARARPRERQLMRLMDTAVRAAQAAVPATSAPPVSHDAAPAEVEPGPAPADTPPVDRPPAEPRPTSPRPSARRVAQRSAARAKAPTVGELADLAMGIARDLGVPAWELTRQPLQDGLKALDPPIGIGTKKAGQVLELLKQARLAELQIHRAAGTRPADLEVVR